MPHDPGAAVISGCVYLQAKELEERRRRRAELEAKLASSAAVSVPASADGGSQRDLASPIPDAAANGQQPDAADAAVHDSTDDAHGEAVEGRVVEGAAAADRAAEVPDVVNIGSDGEERQMEDLFRAPGQVRCVRWMSASLTPTRRAIPLLLCKHPGQQVQWRDLPQ